LTDYPDAVSPSELYFRLFYLSQKNMIRYDDQYDTFRPIGPGARQKNKKQNNKH